MFQLAPFFFFFKFVNSFHNEQISLSVLTGRLNSIDPALKSLAGKEAL